MAEEEAWLEERAELLVIGRVRDFDAVALNSLPVEFTYT